ncbi:tail fiber protein [Escherichia phage EG1]|uniref:Tail fiber protein n=1 Tax=Escherichia phage EG1 TaxID=2053563 RepID=A0A2H4P6H6_9CAUD|nr:tail fiber protein [Escherichia phage EG1]ATW57755.1 tail fiber protein [Escherichia phage EG1]
MANVIKTVLTYPLDGSNRDFNIPFEYLARKFVVVTLIGVDRKVLTLNTDYRFATRTTISLTKSWGTADGYTTIELRRVTSTTDRLVDFTDGSILRAYDLNVAQIQTMHVAEEARDLTADTIGVNNNGHLDARGRKIVNLAYATGDYDAVPLKQVKERETSAWNAATKANEHADRSNREANRSRDEANRAQREADRSTQQADVSKQQAVESKKQADRSDAEADRAKGYADSMIASVAEAEKQADRADSEANRARDEANRAAGEVTKAAAEVAKAAAHVETAKGHADRANTEANRSKGEADRAKSEADKLGNMNSLAGAIDRVEDSDVYFKGKVGSRVLTLHNDAKGADTQPVDLVWNQWRGQNAKDTVWEQWIQAGTKRMDFYVFNNTDPATWPEGRSNGHGRHDFYGGFHSHHDSRFYQNVSMDGYLRVSKYIRTDERFYTESTYGSGAFANQLNNNAPYSQSLPGNQDGNVYYPMIKQYGRRSNGYPAAFSIGMVSKGNNNFHEGIIQLKGDGTNEHALTITIHGQLSSNKGWFIPPDGNLYINKYNSYIDAWVNKRLDEHIYNKSTADGRYIRKNAGWSEVWKGTAGGGVSVSLSQDVRWRTIWIQTNGRWNPVEIGDDGAYYISSMGGWLTFTISNGGRTFKNDRDERSVPTRILVRNN